ncbi:MAG: alpha/beta fold hydrolase [Actinomycetota bacterium]
MPQRLPRSLLAGEAPRAAQEFASFFIARRRLGRGARGDGRPVLVLPGLAGADGSTRALRRLLRALGYYVHAWRLGRNWGPTDRIIDGLQERVRALITEHEQPISLIGHSLGGVYAREIARAAPDAVRQVITLGSPVRRPPGTTSAAAPLFQALAPLHSERVKDVDPDRIRQPIPVPLTAIFTRTDGVVPWRICLVDPSELSENIEVRGSHSGLIHNPAAVTVILDRLGLEEWKPYVEASGVGARVWVEREER